MSKPKVDTMERDSDGQLPAYAWPGGYPLIYVDNSNETLCAKCATKVMDCKCSTCEGIGSGYLVYLEGLNLSSGYYDCIFCNGLKELFTVDGLTSLGDCPACLSTGYYVPYVQCNDCKGTGQDLSVTIQDFDVYYEGPTIQCAECNVNIESAYGDPDAEDTDTKDTEKGA